MKDIAQGLEHLRKKRIVHRDLKLENILIRINKNASKDFVISDFGLASWDYHKAPRFERCGTPGYIAPEVLSSAQGKVVLDHRSDIFSLGVLAHIL